MGKRLQFAPTEDHSAHAIAAVEAALANGSLTPYERPINNLLCEVKRTRTIDAASAERIESLESEVVALRKEVFDLKKPKGRRGLS